MKIQGIHHITAVAGPPRQNLAFYTRVLGQRLVKKTVNFDDPGTYHLYYGDRVGSPGTILTFFPWEQMSQGRTGAGQVTATAYAVARDSLDFWRDRLRELKIPAEAIERFGERGLAFTDPDGMPLEIIGVPEPADLPAWDGAPVPEEHRLRGFHSATLTLSAADASARILTECFGMEQREQDGSRTRFACTGGGEIGTLLTIHADPAGQDHGLGAGIVHHIAFRARDLDDLSRWRERVLKFGLHPTPPIDRDYFMSIYFREPGGVLYEIATDPPGFTRDEDVEALGTSLKLPRQHEPLRDRIEARLPPLKPEAGP